MIIGVIKILLLIWYSNALLAFYLINIYLVLDNLFGGIMKFFSSYFKEMDWLFLFFYYSFMYVFAI